MSNLEKFNHLLHSLKRPALDAIKAFPITDENYPKALQRLNERFDNSTLIFQETIAALFKLQPVEKSNAIQLQGLVDKTSAMYGALESLGTGSNIAQAMLIYIMIDKCDQHTRNKWNESLNFKNLPNWKQCSKLLERHFSIENHLQKLWGLESVAALPESLHPHHQICEALYTSTTVQDSHGRIVVNLPFKDDPSRLGNSIEVARRRFYAMELRMLKFPELRSQYVSFMQEYQALGHMVLVTSPALYESHYYIPRHNKIANVQLQTFQLNTVIYGTAAAPYLAVRSLHYLADKYKEEFPTGASVIKSSFYVDDLLCEANDIDTLQLIKQEVIEVLQKGNFPLTKWHSNHPEFTDYQPTKRLHICEDNVTSALGVIWNQLDDAFLFPFASKQPILPATKRSILSIASSLLDPLGLLSPIIIVAKMILQEVWMLNLNWCESVPQSLYDACTDYLKSLNMLPTLQVPRYCLQNANSNIQLHGFCDASIRAYGCWVYVRTEGPSNITVRLWTSKSRVAPVNKQSVPKLELCTAHLLAKLFNKVKGLFGERLIPSYLWSDSLQQHSVTLSTFVGNRVSEIQSSTSAAKWRFVPTQSNPADIVSRGCTVTDLDASMWFIDSVTGFELIKVGGRRDYFDLPESEMHPLLLPSKSSMVIKYVRHLHTRNFHAGPKALMALLRLKFWIINAWNLARRIVRACTHCIRYQPVLLQQAPSKSYLAVFIYLVVKDVHIEVVTSSHPVKSAKGLLNRTFVSTKFTYEELLTVVVEIEPILNSLPLTPMSSDPNDLSALTAGHFFTGSSLRSMPDRIANDHKASTLQRFEAVTALKQSFWRRWSTDYFTSLRSRTKWTSPSPNVSVGTMVLIHEDNVPHQNWRMGRIESLVYGRDNRVRVVQMRTSSLYFMYLESGPFQRGRDVGSLY
ncbi:uncharacterized protein [Drosophila takahashii]|uniref:uncharacterized protein n=1 Tax=Drosophila takahashii TaxID=29030 RepID=UPI0038991E51